MPEPNTPEPGKQDPATGKGADPSKTENPATPAFEPSKLGDEDFSKIFEDPRLYNHSRFKSLNDRAKKAEEYEANDKKRQEEEMTKKGEFEKLAKTKEEEANKAKAELQTERVNNRIFTEATKSGVVDLEAVIKLINRDSIKTADDGTVTGIAEAVKELLDSKPYLKGDGRVTVGSGTNPGDAAAAGLKRFKHSQIQDTAFYRENEKDILASIKAGLVEDDLQK